MDDVNTISGIAAFVVSALTLFVACPPAVWGGLWGWVFGGGGARVPDHETVERPRVQSAPSPARARIVSGTIVRVPRPPAAPVPG